MTPERIYSLVAEDEQEQLRWLDGLADSVEARDSLSIARKQKQEEEGENSSTLGGELMEAKKKTILCAGYLSKKTGNRLTGSVSWLPRYFVLDRGTYFNCDYSI